MKNSTKLLTTAALGGLMFAATSVTNVSADHHEAAPPPMVPPWVSVTESTRARAPGLAEGPATAAPARMSVKAMAG